MANAVGAVGSAAPTVFAGLAIDAQSNTVRVYLKRGASTDSLERRITTAAEGRSRVDFIAVAHSLSELRALTHIIAEDVSYWTSAGYQFYSFGPDVVSNMVVVRGPAGHLPSQSELDARYPGNLVRAAPGTQFVRQNRRADQPPPWYGGNSNWTYQNECTNAFTIHRTDASNTYVVTAGHCHGNGDYVWSGRNEAYYMGQTGHQQFVNYDIVDVVLIGIDPAKATSRIQGSDRAFLTAGLRESYYGDRVCYSGWVAQERCGLQVYATEQCVQFVDGIWTCDMVEAADPLYRPSSFGDSGATVYNYTGGQDNSEVLVKGMLIGGDAYGDEAYSPASTIIQRFPRNALLIGGS